MTESELMPSTSSWFQSKFNQKNDTYKLKRSVVLIHIYVCTGDASATKIDSFSQSKKTIGHIQTEANRHAFSCVHRKDASGIHNLLITCTSSNLLITCSLTNHPKNIDQG